MSANLSHCHYLAEFMFIIVKLEAPATYQTVGREKYSLTTSMLVKRVIQTVIERRHVYSPKSKYIGFSRVGSKWNQPWRNDTNRAHHFRSYVR